VTLRWAFPSRLAVTPHHSRRDPLNQRRRPHPRQQLRSWCWRTARLGRFRATQVLPQTGDTPALEICSERLLLGSDQGERSSGMSWLRSTVDPSSSVKCCCAGSHNASSKEGSPIARARGSRISPGRAELDNGAPSAPRWRRIVDQPPGPAPGDLFQASLKIEAHSARLYDGYLE
jgi:hypothetical protein